MVIAGSFRSVYENGVSNRSANPRPARLGSPATKLMVAALLILVVMVGVGLAINPSRQQFDWFLRLRRPAWLTFEGLVPLIWISIYACFYGLALLCWMKAASLNHSPGAPEICSWMHSAIRISS